MLDRLIKLGAIDTKFDPFPGQYWPPKYWDWFATVKNWPAHRQNKDSWDLWPAAKSARWQEHRFAPITQDPVTDYWAVELARFAVPSGSVGFLRWIEQVVNDAGGNYYPSNVFYWGSPQFVLPDVDGLRWYLRLEMFNGTQPPRFEIYNAAPIPSHALPGVPYSDLPVIDGLWYPAHRKDNLKLIVPGGWQLRFFMIGPPCDDYQWQVSGKLSGNLQTTFQLAAIDNARGL